MSEKIIRGANEATRKRNPHLYPNECAERADNPEGAESVEADDSPCKDERALHDQFERWLRVHEKGPIPYVHSRMDRKSTIREGWPDFSVFWGINDVGLNNCCFIEFKMAGKEPTVSQVDCIDELTDAGLPVKVCYSIVEAIEFVREKLGL